MAPLVAACHVPVLRAQWARRCLATVVHPTGVDTRPEEQAGRKQTLGAQEIEVKVSAKTRMLVSTGRIRLSPVPRKSVENWKHRGDLQ